jgi:hypothetical protein
LTDSHTASPPTWRIFSVGQHAASHTQPPGKIRTWWEVRGTVSLATILMAVKDSHARCRHQPERISLHLVFVSVPSHIQKTMASQSRGSSISELTRNVGLLYPALNTVRMPSATFVPLSPGERLIPTLPDEIAASNPNRPVAVTALAVPTDQKTDLKT